MLKKVWRVPKNEETCMINYLFTHLNVACIQRSRSTLFSQMHIRILKKAIPYKEIKPHYIIPAT